MTADLCRGCGKQRTFSEVTNLPGAYCVRCEAEHDPGESWFLFLVGACIVAVIVLAVIA